MPFYRRRGGRRSETVRQGAVKEGADTGTVAAAADRIFLHGTCGSCAAAWIAALSYLIQIYYDFSGYSDMAIGLGRALGFRFGNNFNYPYSALTIKDFWKRWHISLSSWFRDYLYIPLGGNRKGKVRTVLNKLFVFLCTGLWHGANWTFVLWGLGHGLLSSLEDFFPNTIAALKKRNMGKMFLRIVTLLAVTVLFVLFRADSLTDGFSIVRDMFAFKNGTVPNNYLAEILSPAYFAAMLFGIVFSFPVLQKIKIRNTIVESALCIILFTVCIFSVSSGGFSPFIYFQF